MPIYEYQCPSGHVLEAYATVEHRNEPQPCRCGQAAQKVILHPPRVFGDYEGYESPATGKWIEGRRAREEDLKASGCQPWEPGMREQIARRREEKEKEFDSFIDDSVERTLAEMRL
jgi:putative FmdB family regulatory protein